MGRVIKVLHHPEVDAFFLDTELGKNQSSRRTDEWHQSEIVARWRGRQRQGRRRGRPQAVKTSATPPQ
jgi:hypothetical protein